MGNLSADCGSIAYGAASQQLPGTLHHTSTTFYWTACKMARMTVTALHVITCMPATPIQL